MYIEMFIIFHLMLYILTGSKTMNSLIINPQLEGFPINTFQWARIFEEFIQIFG